MSDGIVPHSNQLQQQGTVDWGQLAGNLIHFTIDALSRYSAANIDIYTLQIGQLICSQFVLSIDGRRRVSEALSKLRHFGSFGNAIWFGFGLRHIVRTLQMTEQGFMCLALCASLLECYHEDVASEILNEMTKSLKAPPELTPSLSQWKALLHACNGTFATTSLGERIGHYTQLCTHDWGMDGRTQKQKDGCASPDSIADVLRGIGAVTRGQMISITVVGNNNACIIAALAEWLFGLRITIYHPLDQKELFTNCPGQPPQLVICFEPNATATEQHAETLQLRCIGKTYHLKDTTPFLQLRSEISTAFNRGRVPWTALLKTVFGGDFESIYNNETLTLAKAIGAAARLFRAIVSAEAGVAMPLIKDWDTYTKGSSGRDYIANIVEWLPELAPLRRRMETACQISFEDAKVQYENQIAKLQRICSCYVCASGDSMQSADQGEDILQEELPGHSRVKKEIHKQSSATRDNSERFCQVVIVETIITLGRELSKVIIEHDLLPKRLGLETLYRSQESRRTESKNKLGLFSSLGPVIDSMMNDNYKDSLLEEFGPFALICLRRASGPRATMKACLEIFAGVSYYDSQSAEPCAISHNGICVWLGILQEISDEPEVSDKIHIAPGSIEHLGKPFDHVVDGKLDIYQAPQMTLESVCDIKTANLNVTETSSGLEVCYVLEGEYPSSIQSLRIRPASLTDSIASARGWVHCQKPFSKACLPFIYPVRDGLKIDAKRSFQSVTVFDKEIKIVKAKNISRCAALVIAERYARICVLLKDQRHCLNCYFRAALSDSINISYWLGKREQDRAFTSPLCIVCESEREV